MKGANILGDLATLEEKNNETNRTEQYEWSHPSLLDRSIKIKLQTAQLDQERNTIVLMFCQVF